MKVIINKNQILNLFIILFLFNNCQQRITGSNKSHEINFSIHPEKSILKVQDSTILFFNIEDYNISELDINWRTNVGEIIGNGSTIKYLAPREPTKSSIITDIVIDDNVYSDTVELVVYKQIIILKADDIVFDPEHIISERWSIFFDYVREKNIKADLGLIGNSLEKGNSKYYSVLIELEEIDNFELWNHGYNHLLGGTDNNGDEYHEFKNTSYNYQKEHLLKTQNLAKEKLNITLRGFGAPGNNIDSNTVKALEEIPKIRVWYYGIPNSEKFVLDRSSNIEFPCGTPNFSKFISAYDENRDCITFQIHPNSWDNEKFLEFANIINFLIDNKVTFLNAYEYYCLINE